MYEAIIQKIRVINDWPEPEQRFFDYLPALADPALFNQIVDGFCEPYLNEEIDLVISVDARGLILAAPVAYALDAGLALVSPHTHMPWLIKTAAHLQEQLQNMVAMQHELVNPGDRVIIVDDILASGKTAERTAAFLENMGAEVVGLSFLLELPWMRGRERLEDYPITILLNP